MAITLGLTKQEEIGILNKMEEKAFDVHRRYFEGGILPGNEGDENDIHLEDSMKKQGYTCLTIYDEDKIIGGSTIMDIDEHTKEIVIFFLDVSYQSKGLGKDILEMIENYFPEVKVWRLITPSQVVRNVVFYVNKCGYHIVKVIGYNREKNEGDYLFEKHK